MSFVSRIIDTAERVPLPDVVIRAAIQRLCSRTATRLASGNAESDVSFADEMSARAIAEYTDEANAQHYEVPTEFFRFVLGPRMKYSSGYWPAADTTFEDSEKIMLALTCERAELAGRKTAAEVFKRHDWQPFKRRFIGHEGSVDGEGHHFVR